MFNHQKIEKKWRKIWEKKGIYEPSFAAAPKGRSLKKKKKFYNLMMFPYLSAEGLHVGNVYAFVGSDTYGRFKRMSGCDVFEPIGLDGFGIHSENYALKIGAHPMKQAKISEKRFYRQLAGIGNGFSWNEKLETYDPEYYKWTQWIFVQMFKNGLAYRKKQAVNWCPSCKTVLADEQVINGKCERCDSLVIKKELEQWFFKITEYAERLLKNLEKIDWSERVKIAQREWIGKSEGATIKFEVQDSKFKVGEIDVFTTRPDTIFGATYLVLAPEHVLVASLLAADSCGTNADLRGVLKNKNEVQKYVEKTKRKSDLQRTDLAKEKTGVELKGIKAINPATKKEIPIWVADYVLVTYGTGAIMAVPAHDERDFEFAKRFKLPIVKVINPVLMHVANPAAKADAAVSELAINAEFWEGEGEMVNSGKFNGMDSEKARREITKSVEGKRKIQYHLRDWLISRQRYWGAPIPMIYCHSCAEDKKGERKDMPGWYSVPEGQLPVKLPYVENFRPQGKGISPLASIKSFYEVKCPKCGKKAKRETDVSDTFLDSAWYYLRYPSTRSARSGQVPWDSNITKRWLPVDMYIGGAEHSVLHLLYSRFLTMFVYDLKLLHFEEPFAKFRAHGLVIKEGAKMSKSKGNVIVPDEYVKKFGADTLRMYLMFLAPFEQGGDFRDAGILGIKRFLDRVYKLFNGYREPKGKREDGNVERLFHQTVRKITEDIGNLRYNTCISAMMILFNEIEKSRNCDVEILEGFLKLLAPFAPFITEELWEKLGHKTGIHKEKWPEYNLKLAQEKEFELVIQINGKMRDKIFVSADISQKEAEKIAFSREKVENWVKGKRVKKIIFVPNRLINIVL